MKVTRTQVPTEEYNVFREAAYIVQCAEKGSATIVSLGPLLFFSARNGDAWIIDPADKTARPLVLNRAVQPLGITENSERFEVEWSAKYQFIGDVLIITLNSGRVVASLDYPAREIKAAIRRMGL